MGSKMQTAYPRLPMIIKKEKIRRDTVLCSGHIQLTWWQHNPKMLENICIELPEICSTKLLGFVSFFNVYMFMCYNVSIRSQFVKPRFVLLFFLHEKWNTVQLFFNKPFSSLIHMEGGREKGRGVCWKICALYFTFHVKKINLGFANWEVSSSTKHK